ncbi:MAG: protein-L-isoaspartate(D-aspartate) O-methyltransferase, partial [Rhodospirillales bacterium]|nr:protein-L-isoaspartate(D-aspartate) O-methyltransferase [Rhodospirillales bacterium]
AFAPPESATRAWRNAPLGIGHGQTMSQPFIVALMTDLAHPAPGARVLEVGTGSGYQAAVLAELGADVASIEFLPELADRAGAALRAEGYDRVALRTGDGRLGWPERAPFDAILVTAAAPEIPPALIAQLAPGGRMAIPVGPADGEQRLMLVEKDADGRVRTTSVLPVLFVPLVRGPAQPGS